MKFVVKDDTPEFKPKEGVDVKKVLTQSNPLTQNNKKSQFEDLLKKKKVLTGDNLKDTVALRKLKENYLSTGGKEEDENYKILDSLYKDTEKKRSIWEKSTDFSATVGSTIADVGVNVLKGAGKVFEGAVDLADIGYSKVASLVEEGSMKNSENYRLLQKPTETTKDGKVVTKSSVGELADILKDKTGIEELSISNDTADAIAESIGSTITIGLTGNVAGAAGMSATATTSSLIFADAFSSAHDEAINSGADSTQATIYGTLSGLTEVGTEMMFSGLGKRFNAAGFGGKALTDLDDRFAAKLTKNLYGSPILKNSLQYMVKSGAEGVEEVVSSFADAVWKKATYMSDEDFGKILKDENILDQFIMGSFTSALLQSGDFVSTVKNKTDFVTRGKLDTNETVKDTVKSYETQTGTKLTDSNVKDIEVMAKTYKENGITPTTDMLLNDFTEMKSKKIEKFQNETLNMFKLDEQHQVEYNQTVNDLSQIMFDTDTDVIFDANQNNVVSIEGGKIILNPTKTDMPIRNVVNHELALELVDGNAKIVENIKKDANYNTYKQELLSTGEFDEYNVDYEIVSQQLDNILTNEQELKALDNDTFNLINDTVSSLRITEGTKDANYYNAVLDNLSNVSNEMINTTTETQKSLEMAENVSTKGNKVVDDKGKEIVFNRYQPDAMNIDDNFDYNKSETSHKTGFGINFTDDDKYIKGKKSKDVLKTTISTKKGLLYDTNNKVSNENIDKLNKVFNNYIPGENAFVYNMTEKQIIDYINQYSEMIANAEDNNAGRKAFVEFYDALGKDGYLKTESDGSKLLSLVNKDSIDELNKNRNKTEEKSDLLESLSSKDETFEDNFEYEEGAVEEYKSNEKLPGNVKKGTYIAPTTPIDVDSKKGQSYVKKVSGESLIKKGLSKDYTSLVDKLHPIDELAKVSGNKKLYPKYNNRGMANGMGQYQIGTAQTDINGKEIGKSINEIWKPIEDAKLVNEFNDYLAHRLNEERYDKVPVWDEEITPEISKEIIDDYEQKYPQFKDWAKDVYEFNDNQLQKMIDAGLSKENARDWLYDNYVTISRETGPKTNPLSTYNKGVKVNSPIRRAKGGDLEIAPMKDSMSRQVLLTERAVADNIAGQELLNVLGGTVGETKSLLTEDLEGNNNALVKNSDGTYNYTIYKNGVPVTMQVTKEIADAIRPTKRGEWENAIVLKGIRGFSKFQRTLLTDKNPMFIFTNFFKDFGDAMLNTKYSGGEFLTMYPQAIAKMKSNSPEWKQYVAKGGKSNTYFDTKEGEIKPSKNPIKRAGQKMVDAIENANSFIEQAPRFTEYLNTLAHGGTIDEALYNSAEITTNFARGGEITKALNRNGFNFLNASVQGFDKQIRNFTGQNGVKGYVSLLAKVVIYGITPAMLNHIILGDDDDYEELPDYVKDNYYLFKTGDNKFIRIPKGRMMSVFGTAARHTLETAQGKEELGKALRDTSSLFINNVAPNNPLENNILSPVLSVMNNKGWNGSPIVGKSLERLPDDMQYDERTSAIAKWIGKTFNYSPKKADYLLDQYTGAIGDFVLPMTTPAAETDSNNPLVSAVVSPIKSKFTADSTISNKYVDEYYDIKDKLEKETKRYSSIEETPESFEKSLQYKYLDTVGEEISALYSQKKEIQNSNLNDSDKYNQAKAIQRKIDDIAKFAVQDYTEGYYTDSYAVIGDKEFYVKMTNGKLNWSKVDENTKKKQEQYSTDYDMSPEDYYSMKDLTKSTIVGSNVFDFNKYDSELKTIRDNTKDDKNETIKYVNSLNLSIPQKAMYIKMYYPSYNDYNKEIFSYINSLDLIYDQKKSILINLGFKYDKNTKQFSWR